jgi:hypothetical protein
MYIFLGTVFMIFTVICCLFVVFGQTNVHENLIAKEHGLQSVIFGEEQKQRDLGGRSSCSTHKLGKMLCTYCKAPSNGTVVCDCKCTELKNYIFSEQQEQRDLGGSSCDTLPKVMKKFRKCCNKVDEKRKLVCNCTGIWFVCPDRSQQQQQQRDQGDQEVAHLL